MNDAAPLDPATGDALAAAEARCAAALDDLAAAWDRVIEAFRVAGETVLAAMREPIP